MMNATTMDYTKVGLVNIKIKEEWLESSLEEPRVGIYGVGESHLHLGQVHLKLDIGMVLDLVLVRLVAMVVLVVVIVLKVTQV